MVMRQCREGEKWCRYWNSFKDRNKGFCCLRLVVSTAELVRDIHGCPVSKSKAPWIRVHSRHKAGAVTVLYLHHNNKLFHGKTVKGINKVLSINTPTLHATQTKSIMQLRWGVFLCFNLTLICSWHYKLNIWQCNYRIWFQWDMQPLSSLHALAPSFPKGQCYHIYCCCGCEIR